MNKKRILLVTSKFPFSTTESDGGLSTVASVIESLKADYILDILFVREFNENETHIPGVNNIFFEEIARKSSNKYTRRISNYNQISKRILEMESNYDLIIIIHASKAFGLEKGNNQLFDKIILYPMFLSYAYIESGQSVPDEYTLLEKNVFKKIKWIICPSMYDKNQIIKRYGDINKNYYIIPRSVSNYIVHQNKTYKGSNRLLSIGNIKERKQPLLLLSIFKKVKDEIKDATLTFAGEIQDKKLYEECLTYISKNKLEGSVQFLGAVSQKEIGKLISISDLNVCTSKLETFGRCIFEGLYGGLPTIIFDNLTVVKEFVKENEGLCIAKTDYDFCDYIIKLLKNENYYNIQSQKAIKATEFISFESEKKLLLKTLNEIEEFQNGI